MFELTVEAQFPAAHCLPEHPGRCAQLHGHTYRALITVTSDQLNAQGMVMDFADLKELCARVLAPLDHAYLNELPAFAGTAPTAEVIARYIYQSAKAELDPPSEGGAEIARVTVYESETSFATYRE
jgi:6-pyruvoyltetrahydropterin/6-carboxytetrahydropterin synthase